MSTVQKELAGAAVEDIPLEALDVSEAHLYENDSWRPYFARLRREAPVHYLADSANGAFWSVTSWPLIKEVDTSHGVLSSANGISIVDPPQDSERAQRESQFNSFISMDPPEHGAQRNTVQPAVAPRNLAQLEPLIRERAADILDNLPVGETFDWVDRVSVELTARMLATLFDFPYEDRRKLIYWSDTITNVPQVTGDDSIDMEKRHEDLMECAGTFFQLWQDRAAAEPKFDLISMMAHGDATKHLGENPLAFLGNVMLLIVGGNDTTRNSISGGVVALNENPDQYAKLRSNPGLIPNMVSEMIRWQTPVIHMRRTALQDLELGDQKIAKGDKVVMWYLSGNRDDDVFEDADAFRIDRPNARQHVSFGYGIHRCMGNRLAEMQLRILWEEILERFEKVELAGEVERVPNNFIRGIREVPVRVIPR